MTIKIKDSFVVEANSNRIKGYLLSKAMRKEACTDEEMMKIYSLTVAEFNRAADILIRDGIAERVN